MNRSLDRRISNMEEPIALPRKNGELVFETPWEARAFGIAVALNEGGVYDWRDFSAGLAAAISADEQEGASSGYYEQWLAALEKLAVARGLVSQEEVDARATEYTSGVRDDHHDHHDHHDHDHSFSPWEKIR